MIIRLPDILNVEQEKEAIKRLSQGDIKARQMLIETNLRLVLHTAIKFSQRPDMVEEYFAVGCIGLVKGIDTYNPNKKTRLSTYISTCIENEIKMEFRREKKHRHVTSFHEPAAHGNDGEELLLIDILASKEDVSETVLLNMVIKTIREAVNKLETREREVIKKKYFGGMTNTEISKEFGVSKERIYFIEKRARKKLRRELV